MSGTILYGLLRESYEYSRYTLVRHYIPESSPPRLLKVTIHPHEPH
ncbi:hypothetical protein P755_gp144 [Mycobacterium phage Quink]|uniref:Uncharacterized protein n=2 Tax=Kostyavirus CJW1 TaxID=205869 RepID=Q857P6_9CAUD|nr:gp118 [Mycobacterium phage Cjw1]YP_008052046.1 hypothetical protein PBI_PHRUX_112 [Mycobacterium phage Phrux]YP_008531193.1 hypothetical protein P755_gp144 [Mycobacterium phage Quink]AEL21855.1 hypothetical protein ELPH10_115 [Mycobacterium phage Elph10]AVO23591.1 hypothetical protein SEA_RIVERMONSTER_115 [Mycobacterium phage RiverMonster]AXC37494.1 hypothetical protein SEA_DOCTORDIDDLES_115 [Mycobacterium phage DoctorDiddles]AYR00229.1 hypothetical protein PBI_PAT3_116 [Mycobacterium phag